MDGGYELSLSRRNVHTHPCDDSSTASIGSRQQFYYIHTYCMCNMCFLHIERLFHSTYQECTWCMVRLYICIIYMILVHTINIYFYGDLLAINYVKQPRGELRAPLSPLGGFRVYCTVVLGRAYSYGRVVVVVYISYERGKTVSTCCLLVPLCGTVVRYGYV